MPHTVVPPPWNGDAAVGHWSPAASDSAPSDEAPSGARTSEPALQTSAATARTVAAGVALLAGLAVSLAAVVIAGVVVGTAAALRLLFSGDGRMTFDLEASALLLAGFAVSVAATMTVPNRWVTPRPATLLLAAIVSAAWPLSGYPFPAAIAAVVAVGLALAHDIRHPGGPRVRGTVALALLAGFATAFMLGGLALAETHRTDRGPARESARTLQPLGDSPAAEADAPAGGPDVAPSPEAQATPDAVASPAPTADPEAAKPAPEPEAPAPSTPGAADPAPTPEAPAADAEPTPETPAADPAPTADAPAPEAFIRDYYALLNDKRFDDAWALLSPAVRTKFGDFDGWRDGYANTQSSSPTAFEVDGTRVTLVLVARDRGCPERRFRVRWRLQAAGDGWTVAALSASALDSIVCR